MVICMSCFRFLQCGAILALSLAALSARAAVHQVELNDTAIVPETVVVAPGDTVRWLVVSGSHQLHSDTDSYKSWDSGPLTTPGQTFDLPIEYADGPGLFLYRCLWHHHWGAIEVADTCRATGSLGEGPPSIADLVYVLRVMAGEVPPPDQLYKLDLNGDCVVSTPDAELIVKLFQFGPDSFPAYPVPTCCRPQLVVPSCLITLTGDLDLNRTLTTADIIRLVNYVFRGGLPPSPCAAAGDVNCSGAVSAADVIALVNHVLKSGPPPCDVCDLIPGLWVCP
jgi:plastocyanin